MTRGGRAKGGGAASTAPVGLVGRSPALLRLVDQADAVARSSASVVVTGESGTGKELVARLVHARSPRKGGPFVAINCASFPDSLLEAELFGHARGAFTGARDKRAGLFRAADRGTLFLDEVAELSVAAQARLLRVLEDGVVQPLGVDAPVPVEVRVVSATNQPLRALVESGGFRQDLYYRLKVVELVVPPLRDRASDIPMLIGHFVDRLGRGPVKMTPRARGMLLRWRYPGNVRELAHAVEHAVVLSRGAEIDVKHLPDEIVQGVAPGLPVPERTLSLSAAVARFERRHLVAALRDNGGNRTRTAQKLGISRKNLWEKMRSHEIEVDEFVPAPDAERAGASRSD